MTVLTAAQNELIHVVYDVTEAPWYCPDLAQISRWLGCRADERLLELMSLGLVDCKTGDFFVNDKGIAAMAAFNVMNPRALKPVR